MGNKNNYMDIKCLKQISLGLLAGLMMVILFNVNVFIANGVTFDCTVEGNGTAGITTLGKACGVRGTESIILYCGPRDGTGKVDLLCTTNGYNICPTNVCLVRSGDRCAFDWQCEGGTVCSRPSGSSGATGVCEVDTGDDSLGGTLGTGSDIRDTARRFINIALGFLGVLVVLMVIYGGTIWLTSSGSEENVTKGKHILVWASIGAIIITIAWTIASYILKFGKSIG